MTEPIQIYICYAEENTDALFRLEQQLKIPITAGVVRPWHRGKLGAGDDKSQHIAANLDQATIIILLVSADLFNSEDYERFEMRHAFQLYREQRIPLIPIIVKPCLWHETHLRDLVPLPRGGEPAGLDEKVWYDVAMEINQMARKMQAEQAEKEPAAHTKSTRSRAKSRKPANPKPQPFSEATVTTITGRVTTRPRRSTPPSAPTQLALGAQALPTVIEPEPDSDEARAATPTFRQDYDQTQNDFRQVVFTILIWEPSQSTHDLIANERRAIYHALLAERHQCTLGSSLPVPEGLSLQDCEISQVYASDKTILLLEPQAASMSEWQEFYRDYNDEFLNKILCYYPQSENLASGGWKLDEILYWRDRLHYYQETEITSCHVRTKVLKWVHVQRLEVFRKQYKSRSGR